MAKEEKSHAVFTGLFYEISKKIYEVMGTSIDFVVPWKELKILGF